MAKISNEAREVIPSLPDIYDEPFADSSQIPTHLVCRIAREHVTVALSGDAGDELFGGYNRYRLVPRLWRRLGRMPRPARRALAGVLTGFPPSAIRAALRLRGSETDAAQVGNRVPRLARALAASGSMGDFHREIVSEWPFSVAGGWQAQASKPNLPIFDSLPMALTGDAVGEMQFRDCLSYLPDDILCKVDRAAMAVSLETRVPFLDPAVIDVAWRLPLSMKIRDGQGKWLVRQLLYRHVPKRLIERPKAGFAIPIGAWLRGPLRDWAEALLDPVLMQQQGYIDPVPVRQAWEQHLSGRRDWTPRLWTVLMFQAWLAHWHA